jgi:ABC-type sugar transport system ATPase subunit
LLGISPVHQELQLEPYLSVAENIFLGRQPTGRLGIVDHQRMHREARHLLDSLGVTIDSTAPIESISIAQRLIVAIARAVLGTARVIIFDEPTSSLTERETALLFEMISKLRKTGIGIIYISHRIEEIFRLYDRVTVLRDGRIRVSEEKRLTRSYVEQLTIKTPSIDQKTLYLSGGNQQRVVIAKWLATQR